MNLFDENAGQTSVEPEMCGVAQRPLAHILIIDDDFAQAEALAVRFRQQGFHVSIATTCHEGLATATSERPDVVVLDLRLPDGDGLDICAKLSDDKSTADIPVIIVSGVDRPDIVRRARAVGCKYYVRKPYDPNALLILVQNAIEDTRNWCI